VVVVLERDPDSPFGGGTRGAVVSTRTSGSATGPAFGGDVSSAAAGLQRRRSPRRAGMLHAGYELRGGFGFALDAGYLLTTEHTRGRPISRRRAAARRSPAPPTTRWPSAA